VRRWYRDHPALSSVLLGTFFVVVCTGIHLALEPTARVRADIQALDVIQRAEFDALLLRVERIEAGGERQAGRVR